MTASLQIIKKWPLCLLLLGTLVFTPWCISALDKLTKLPAAATSPRILTQSGEVVLLANRDYYGALMQRLKTAEKRIEMAMFLFKTGRSSDNRPTNILDELIMAKKRGVHVLVILEKSDQDDNLNSENARSYKLLRKNGIDAFFEDPKTTTHTKLVVIDHRYCFVGSHNFTNSALAYNNEVSLLVDSETLARELSAYIKGIIPKK